MKYLISAITIVILLTACDLFTTRDSEKPDEGRSNFKPPVDPTIVIENLVSSLADKNVQNYLLCFVDTLYSDKRFSFNPSAGALSTFQSLWQDWNLTDERQYYNSVVSKVPADFPITLILNSENYSSIVSDTLLYTAVYTISIPHNEQGIPKNFAGNLQFTMVRDSRPYWTIFRWSDTKNQEASTWSEMKGIFYQ